MPIAFKPAWLIAAGILAALAFAVPAGAETGTAPPPSPPGAETGAGPAPPSSPSAAASPHEMVARFVAGAIPNANFIAQASRMAGTYSRNGKLRDLASQLAKEQFSVANALTAWVNVSGPVVTRSPFAGQAGGALGRVSAPRLLQEQADKLQQLSTTRGGTFDKLYVSSVMAALVQLQTLYREFAGTGTDAGLQAIADRELPKVETAISALDAL